MPTQFVVPQFIDVEDKIFGPITVRQFIIILVDFGIVFLFYKIFDFALFVLLGLPTLGIGFVLAFIKINGQPFHFFLLNFLQTARRPRLRIWDKTIPESVLRELIRAPEVKPPPLPPKKPPLEASRLTELTLVVNTGGVYRPEDFE
ncbi:PrgI family protein [Candidatus Uhrbacteria bacterium]|nr:PrgI family protein [Candidatus Uhrbacteria bacterium]